METTTFRANELHDSDGGPLPRPRATVEAIIRDYRDECWAKYDDFVEHVGDFWTPKDHEGWVRNELHYSRSRLYAEGRTMTIDEALREDIHSFNTDTCGIQAVWRNSMVDGLNRLVRVGWRVGSFYSAKADELYGFQSEGTGWTRRSLEEAVASYVES